jgi:hypothetical protein
MTLIIIKVFWHVICCNENGQYLIPFESNSIEEVFGARYPVLVYGNFSDFYISLYEYN